MENRFNLIDEPWIPVADHGRASLRDIFSNPELRSLGGNPVEKIALLKLLLAIAQAAATPEDNKAWQALGADGLAQKCLEYLQRWHDCFWLYGERPFLQLPAIVAAKIYPYASLSPQTASGNTTVLNESQIVEYFSDAERAVLLICQMGFCLGGKKADNAVVLTPGYTGKKNDKGNKSTPCPGSAIGSKGFLHSFLVGASIQQTLWLNLFTTQQIERSRKFATGLGKPPWETMPNGEDDTIARDLRQSLIGRLIPLGRFCLLTDEGVHSSEGIAPQSNEAGFVDPTVAADYSNSKGPAFIWAKPDKRPWRELVALLGFLSVQGKHSVTCWQLEACLDRALDLVGTLGVWSGGLTVSTSMGEQKPSGTDDFVSSETLIPVSRDMSWLTLLNIEMDGLNSIMSKAKQMIRRYYEATTNGGKRFTPKQAKPINKIASKAEELFWQLCERDFQQLVNHCESTEDAMEARRQLRYGFTQYALQAYDHYCPNETARQMDAWASCRPNFIDYLKLEV